MIIIIGNLIHTMGYLIQLFQMVMTKKVTEQNADNEESPSYIVQQYADRRNMLSNYFHNYIFNIKRLDSLMITSTITIPR